MKAETDSNATMYSCVYGTTTVIVSHNLFKTMTGTRQQRANSALWLTKTYSH